MPQPAPILLDLEFGALDWAVVAAYFLLTTLLGAKLAGRQATIRDFFLAGRRMPWYAVAGSIVATELSAVTFVSVPFVVYRPGGDFTYLQLGLFGALFSRLIVAWVLVPAYYRREIMSPYDFMGERLGAAVRAMTTALFTLGGLLAQSARVYLTAVVLELVLGEALFRPLEQATGLGSLTLAIYVIGAVAVLWTLLGGITTVIWTDVILFFVFLIGGAVALLEVAGHLDGGFRELLEVGRAAGKFRLFDLDTDPTKDFTLWAAAIASTWFMVGIYGTDQLMAQRMFCCRGVGDARRAVVASFLGQGVTALMMLVGVGLYAYYQTHPLAGESLRLVEERGDRIFPIFIIDVVPAGLTGLIVAGIFAAAISSLDSILAALSQTSMSALYLPWRRRRLEARGLAAAGVAAESRLEARHQVRVSRVFVVCWGLALCLMAQVIIAAAEFYPSLLQLALAMATYTSGGLLAGFLLAFLPLRVNGYGFLFSAPLSVLLVFALAWHPAADGDLEWTTWVATLGAAAVVVVWLVLAAHRRRPVARLGRKTGLLLVGAAAVPLANLFAFFARAGLDGEPLRVSVAWPWYAPAGCTLAFFLGWALADRRAEAAGDASVEEMKS